MGVDVSVLCIFLPLPITIIRRMNYVTDSESNNHTYKEASKVYFSKFMHVSELYFIVVFVWLSSG